MIRMRSHASGTWPPTRQHAGSGMPFAIWWSPTEHWRKRGDHAEWSFDPARLRPPRAPTSRRADDRLRAGGPPGDRPHQRLAAVRPHGRGRPARSRAASEDGRARALRLTARGKKLARAIDEHSAGHFDSLVKRLGGSVGEVVAALERVSEAMAVPQEANEEEAAGFERRGGFRALYGWMREQGLGSGGCSGAAATAGCGRRMPAHGGAGGPRPPHARALATDDGVAPKAEHDGAPRGHPAHHGTPPAPPRSV